MRQGPHRSSTSWWVLVISLPILCAAPSGAQPQALQSAAEQAGGAAQLAGGVSQLAGGASQLAGGAAQAAPANWQGYPISSGLSAPVFAVPGTPTPSLTPPFYANFGLQAREAWTDNVYLIGSPGITGGGHNSDEIEILSPSVNLTALTRRLNIGANYTLSYDWYDANPKLDGPQHNGIAQATIDLSDHELYIDSHASISQQAINPNGASAAQTRSLGTNQERTIAYLVGPRWEETISDWLVTQVAGAEGKTLNSGNTVSTPGLTTAATDNNNQLANTDYHSGRVELRSSQIFTRWQWLYSSEFTQTNQSGQILDQTVHQLASEYRLSSSFGLLSTIGDEHLIGEGLSANLSGLLYNAGFHWNPTPNLDLRVTDGRRANAPDLLALLDYRIGPRTVLRLAHSIKVTNDPENLFANLNSAQRDPQGNFVDPFSGLTASPVSSAFQLSNGVYRQETSNLALLHSDERDSLSLTARLDKQTFLSGPTVTLSTLTGVILGQSSTDLSASARWQHNFTRNFNASITLNDNQVLAISSGGTRSKTYTAQVVFAYAINPSLNAELNYRLNDTLQPLRGNPVVQNPLNSGNVKEDYVYIALRRSF